MKRIKSVNKAFDTFFEKVIDEHIQSNDGRTNDFADVMVASINFVPAQIVL